MIISVGNPNQNEDLNNGFVLVDGELLIHL